MANLILKFPHSTRNAFDAVPVQKVMPGVKTVEQAKVVHYSFSGYREKLRKHGIMAFDISPVI